MSRDKAVVCQRVVIGKITIIRAATEIISRVLFAVAPLAVALA
jgi:hypothetical protein